jgi:DeoR/GlpR family transcriptional regulator of sugar metabolism
LTAERILAVRREMAKEAAERVEKTAKAAGVSPETIMVIRRDLLGMAN